MRVDSAAAGRVVVIARAVVAAGPVAVDGRVVVAEAAVDAAVRHGRAAVAVVDVPAVRGRRLHAAGRRSAEVDGGPIGRLAGGVADVDLIHSLFAGAACREARDVDGERCQRAVNELRPIACRTVCGTPFGRLAGRLDTKIGCPLSTLTSRSQVRACPPGSGRSAHRHGRVSAAASPVGDPT